MKKIILLCTLILSSSLSMAYLLPNSGDDFFSLAVILTLLFLVIFIVSIILAVIEVSKKNKDQ